MKFTARIVEPEKRWSIVTDGEAAIGTVERLATGYMVTLTDPGRKIKRFRMIDALREALGEEAVITIEKGSVAS